jgi:hypothetical protein
MLLQQFEGERGGLCLGIFKAAAKDFVVVRSRSLANFLCGLTARPSNRRRERQRRRFLSYR